MSVLFTQVEKQAMTLCAEERARLADRLWESLAEHQQTRVVMTPELERSLDEGLRRLERAKTTDELRRR